MEGPKLLISGGANGGSIFTSTEVFPKIKTCTIPSIPKPSLGHALFLTAGLTPVVAYCGGKGDKGEHFDSCVVWDSNNQRWDENMMRPLPQRREGHSVVTFENIGVYVIGGKGSKNSQSTSDFLPANSLQWKRGPGLPKKSFYQLG